MPSAQQVNAKKLFAEHAEALAFVEKLQATGATEPVDVDPNGITLVLPEWYDAALFKRLVGAQHRQYLHRF